MTTPARPQPGVTGSAVACPDTTSLKSAGELADVKTVSDSQSWLSKAAGSVGRDLALAVRMVVRNSVAGSVIVPQILRTMVYRWSGLDIRSFNVREGQVFDNDHVHIGDRTFVNRSCSFEGDGLISIGNDCRIGPGTAFITSTHERLPDRTINKEPVSLDIRVEDGAWIGARSVILPGAVIERDCIIGAGAVVRGRCLAGESYGGVPARLLRSKGMTGEDAAPLHLAR